MDEHRYLRIDSNLAPFSPCADRFVTGGYREPVPFERQLELLAAVPGIVGVALDYPTQFTDGLALRELAAQFGLRVGMVEVDMYSTRDWQHGSLTAGDAATRQRALERCRRAVEEALAAEAADVQLWLGQDGYDYPFQADYREAWARLRDGIAEVAAHRPEMRITVEYKLKEPRNRCHLATAAAVLSLILEIGAPNLGATLDVGHSLMALESPAEAAVLLGSRGRLFHLHLNDNFRDWDHDMSPASVHLWEQLELFYWLRQLGFDGWYGLDTYPYREDGRRALERTVRMVYWLHETAAALPADEITRLQQADDVAGLQDLLQQHVLQPPGPLS